MKVTGCRHDWLSPAFAADLAVSHCERSRRRRLSDYSRRWLSVFTLSPLPPFICQPAVAAAASH